MSAQGVSYNLEPTGYKPLTRQDGGSLLPKEPCTGPETAAQRHPELPYSRP